MDDIYGLNEVLNQPTDIVSLLSEKNNYKTLNKLLSVIQTPYDPKVDISKFQKPAPISKEKYQTFCGT